MFVLTLRLHNTYTEFARAYLIGLLDTEYESTAFLRNVGGMVTQ